MKQLLQQCHEALITSLAHLPSQREIQEVLLALKAIEEELAKDAA